MIGNENFRSRYRNIYPYIWQITGRSAPFIFTYIVQNIFFDSYGSTQFSSFWTISITWVIINSIFSGGIDQFYASNNYKFKYIFYEKLQLILIANLICLTIFVALKFSLFKTIFIITGLSLLSLTELCLLNHRINKRDIHVIYPRLIQSLLLLILISSEIIRSKVSFEFSFAVSWAVAFLFSLHYNKNDIKINNLRFKNTIKKMKRYFIFGAPIAFSQVWANADYISLVFFVSPSEAGNYRYIWYIAFATAPIYAAISTIHLTSITKNGNNLSLKRLKKYSIFNYLLIILLSISDIIIIAILKYFALLPILFSIDGNFIYLIILKFSVLINSTNVIIANLITYYRKQQYNFYISMYWSAMSILFSFTLTASMSIFGASISSLLINLGMLLTYLFFLQKLLPRGVDYTKAPE